MPKPIERLSTDLYVPPPPPGPDLRPRNTALIGAAGVVRAGRRSSPRWSRCAGGCREGPRARACGRRCRRVVAGEVVALAAFVGLPPGRFGWWPAAVITAVAVLLLVVTVYRRNAPAWVAALARWRRAGAANRSLRRPRRSTSRTATSCAGCAPTTYEAITMVRVTGQAYAPTFLRGSTVSLTTNVLPLDVLAGLLDQPGGLNLAGIDMVSSRASGAPRHRLPAAVFHAAGRPARRRSARAPA